MNNFDVVFDLPLFKGIEKNDLDAMLQCLKCYKKIYKKGDYIYFEQDDIKNIGIILNGCVDMIKEDIWGNKTILVRIGIGQLFGETFACATDSMSAVTFYASRDSEILLIPFKRVMSTCSMSCIFHHRLIENMVSLIADKNKELMEKIGIVSKKTLREKILAYLSLQAQQQGTRYFTIPLGRMELAEYLCADRSALTRELSNMKADGLLDYEKNIFHVFVKI